MKTLLLSMVLLGTALAAPGWLTAEGYGMHFPWGVTIASASYAAVHRGLGWNRAQSTAFSLSTTAIAIVAKEGADQLRYGGWSWTDAAWSAAGAAAGAAIMNYAAGATR